MSRLLKLSLGRRQGDRYRGPFAETKEQLGGIVVILANDLDRAIELLSKHSGVRLGVRLEIVRLTRRLTLGLQLGSPGLKRLCESANGLNGIVARGRS
jgi:YCII-related domain